jgi:hypothetical protein
MSNTALTSDLVDRGRAGSRCSSNAFNTVGKVVTSEATRHIRAEASRGGSRGVLITWRGWGSYNIELSDEVPAGIIYECLAQNYVG